MAATCKPATYARKTDDMDGGDMKETGDMKSGDMKETGDMKTSDMETGDMERNR